MNPRPTPNLMPPAGLWDAEAKAAFEGLDSAEQIQTKVDAVVFTLMPLLPLHVYGNEHMGGAGECVARGEADLALFIEIMVLEGVKGLFPVPRGDLPDGYSSVKISWEAWVHGLLSGRVS